MMEWIKCSERMPEEDKTVLVLDKEGIFTAHLYLGSFICSCECHDGSGLYNVTHWMQLPSTESIKD